MSENSQMLDWEKLWGVALKASSCENCFNTYLLPADTGTPNCPNCFQDALDTLEGDVGDFAHAHAPELVIPFKLDPHSALQRLDKFAKGIPSRPKDLDPGTIRKRMRRVFLPMWLTDGKVSATWGAEAGFFYEVVSHKEQHSGGSWVSREVKNTRTRWEPRVGQLTRRYDNISSPAMENFSVIKLRLSNYAKKSAVAYASDHIEGAIVQLPTRASEDALPDAVAGFMQAANIECKQAIGADDMRGFQWSVEPPEDLNWTLMLLPLYSVYYLDDDGKPQVIFINGENGKLWGMKKSSMKRAKSTALMIGLGAVGVFMCAIVSLLASVALPALILLAVVMGIFSIVVGVVAIMPLARASNFNKKYQSTG